MDLLSLASASPLLDLLTFSPLEGSTRPRDLHDLLRLPPNTESDPREMLGIYEIPELIRLIGVLDLIGADDPLGLRHLSNPGSSLTDIALWTGLTRRELTQEPPPPALVANDAARLASIAPDFARQTHRLASERGFPSAAIAVAAPGVTVSATGERPAWSSTAPPAPRGAPRPSKGEQRA